MMVENDTIGSKGRAKSGLKRKHTEENGLFQRDSIVSKMGKFKTQPNGPQENTNSDKIKCLENATKRPGHTKAKTGKETSQKSPWIMSCDFCPFTTDTIGEFSLHLDQVHMNDMNEFKCNKCAFTTTAKIPLNEHLR